jgi:hypothetical protein
LSSGSFLTQKKAIKMEKQNRFSILPIIRQNKMTKDGKVPVYLRICCDRKRVELSVKISIDPLKWNSAKGRVKGNTEEARHLNQCIETFEHRVREIYNKAILTGKIITAEGIKNEVFGYVDKQYYLIQQIQRNVTEMESRIGRGYAKGTVKNWKVTLGHLKEFVRVVCLVNDLPLKELDMSFLHALDHYDSTAWCCRANSTVKHIQRLRKIVTKAFRENWIEKDPFAAFKGKHEKTHRTFLTQEELDKIETK